MHNIRVCACAVLQSPAYYVLVLIFVAIPEHSSKLDRISKWHDGRPRRGFYRHGNIAEEI